MGEAKVIENLKAQGYTDVVQVQNNSSHGVDVIARNPLTGEVKCIEVKANTSNTIRYYNIVQILSKKKSIISTDTHYFFFGSCVNYFCNKIIYFFQ
ncbi:MAG: hypothetical protein HC854_09190 [Flavobacterium sp.]|nr:hypothetical protein [Flavobacterium sp.]